MVSRAVLLLNIVLWKLSSSQIKPFVLRFSSLIVVQFLLINTFSSVFVVLSPSFKLSAVFINVTAVLALVSKPRYVSAVQASCDGLECQENKSMTLEKKNLKAEVSLESLQSKISLNFFQNQTPLYLKGVSSKRFSL